jgi:hypothetical protein
MTTPAMRGRGLLSYLCDDTIPQLYNLLPHVDMVVEWLEYGTILRYFTRFEPISDTCKLSEM